MGRGGGEAASAVGRSLERERAKEIDVGVAGRDVAKVADHDSGCPGGNRSDGRSSHHEEQRAAHRSWQNGIRIRQDPVAAADEDDHWAAEEEGGQLAQDLLGSVTERVLGVSGEVHQGDHHRQEDDADEREENGNRVSALMHRTLLVEFSAKAPQP